MATFVMQALGCDVAALNTVHFSMATFPSCFPLLLSVENDTFLSVLS